MIESIWEVLPKFLFIGYRFIMTEKPYSTFFFFTNISWNLCNLYLLS